MKRFLFAAILVGWCFASPIDGAFGAEQYPVVVEAEVRAILSAEREGVLSELRVDTGDRVQEGSLLAVVFHKDLDLMVQKHEASRKYFAFQVDNLTKLNDKGLATDEELAKAEMELTVNAKEISLIQTRIERSQIRSPFSGLVVERLVEPHEWVKPGQPVVELYNPYRLRIVADIPADVAVGMKAGQTHALFFPDLGREVVATLRVFSPQVDVRSNTIKIFWKVTAKQRKGIDLQPGMKGVLRLGSE